MKIKNISKKGLREFGFLIGIGIPLFFTFVIPNFVGHSFGYWFLSSGLPIIFISIFKPYFLKSFYVLWFKLAECLGFINSHLVLGLIFLLILQPTSIIMKLFKYDPLKLRKTNKKSYKEKKMTNKIDLTRIF